MFVIFQQHMDEGGRWIDHHYFVRALLMGEPWEPLLGDLCGDLVGESLPLGELPLMGEPSLTAFPTRVFWIATLSENFFKGSFLSIFSSSAGVY